MTSNVVGFAQFAAPDVVLVVEVVVVGPYPLLDVLVFLSL